MDDSREIIPTWGEALSEALAQLEHEQDVADALRGELTDAEEALRIERRARRAGWPAILAAGLRAACGREYWGRFQGSGVLDPYHALQRRLRDEAAANAELAQRLVREQRARQSSWQAILACGVRAQRSLVLQYLTNGRRAA